MFCFRKQKKQSSARAIQDLETADALDDHEMRTSVNTQEMNAKMSAHFQVKNVSPDASDEFQELESQNSLPIHSMTRPEYPAEIVAPYNTQSTNDGSD